MIQRKATIWVIFFSTVLGGTLAKGQHSTTFDIEFQQFREELVNGQVECILQDSYGFIWFGTNGGLHKYDGFDFEVFRREDKPGSLPSSTILTIFEDSKNNLWIGTAYGAARFNREKNLFETIEILTDINPDGAPTWVRAYIEDENNALYMSSEGLGLHLLNPKKDVFEKVIPPNADELTLEALGHTTDLELGIDGNVWVGSLEKGFSIVNVDDLSVKNYQDLEGKNGKIEHSLFCWTLERDHDGSMWIGTRGIGAFRVFLREIKFLLLCIIKLTHQILIV